MNQRLYRWVICGCSAMLMFVTTGLSINVFSVYQPYIISQNQFTNTQGSLLVTAAGFVSLIALFLVGRFYRLVSYRLGLTLSIFALCASYLVYWRAESFSAYCIGACLSGLSCGFGCLVPASIVLDRWFIDHRGLAVGICAAGTGVSTVVMPPILTKLIEERGLQTAFLAEALLVAALGAVFYLLFRDAPEGWQESTLRGEESGQGRGRLSRGERMILLGALILLGGVGNVGFAHLTVLYTTAGWDGITVAWAITVVGLVMTASKCLYGGVTDRFGARRTNLIFGAFLATGLGLCCFPGVHHMAVLMGAMFCLGMGLPLTNVAFPIWSKDLSPEDFGEVMRMLQIGYFVGKVLFSAMPGQIADAVGSYAPTYGIFLIFTLILLLVVQSLYFRRRRRPLESVGKTGAAG